MSVAISSVTDSLSLHRKPNAVIHVPANGHASGPASRVTRVFSRWDPSEIIAMTWPWHAAPPAAGSQNSYLAPLKPKTSGRFGPVWYVLGYG